MKQNVIDNSLTQMHRLLSNFITEQIEQVLLNVAVFITRAARVVLFSVLSVCDFTCLFVWSVDIHNPRTVRDIITKFSWHHPVVERADKFEHGSVGVRGW